MTDETNALAYNDKIFITTAKRFIVQNPSHHARHCNVRLRVML